MRAPDAVAALLQTMASFEARRTGVLQTLRDMGAVEVGLSAKVCVHAQDKIKLYRFAALARSANVAPVLICYAMVNRPSMLDLQPDRSLIRGLLQAGIDVYLLDWGYPDGADRFTPLDQYVCGYLHGCVTHILAQQRIESLNLLGVCQGGTLSLCYAALEPERVANLITMVTPVDFKTPENLLSHWARHIDVDLLTQSGNVPGELLNLLFLALMPFRLTQQKYVDLLQAAGDRARCEYFMRMEKWLFDSPDQPARAFREFVTWFYQENRLVRGALSMGGRAVRLENFTRPLLNIYAARDHLVPPSATLPLGAHIGSADYEVLEVDVGHVGMYVSDKAGKRLPTAITRWLLDRTPR